MYFVAAAIALAALSKVAGATPLDTRTTSTTAKPVAEGVTSASSFPVHDLGSVSTTMGVSYTSSTTGAHADSADGIYPAYLLACPSSDCSSCYEFDLSTASFETCYIDASSLIYSVAIVQPSNEGLPYGVAVGPPGCSEFVQIPAVNTCYNVVNGPFSDFLLYT